MCVAHPVIKSTSKFQSRNRESYLFKESIADRLQADAEMFQSRNRESYLFKCTFDELGQIESMFQSRNRESYLFKHFDMAGRMGGQLVSIS